MRFIFIGTFLILFLCESNTNILNKYKNDLYNIYTNAGVTARDISYGPVERSTVTYYLFTRDTPGKPVKLDEKNFKTLINPKQKVIFIIHGWTGSKENSWYEDLKNTFLHRDDEYQVVAVDWKDAAAQLYSLSAHNARFIGKFLGEFISQMHKEVGLPIENVLIVGHSLGGHVSGYAGKAIKELTGKQLPRIIALDPAGPLFGTKPPAERLNSTDAAVVEVIHTDGGKLGIFDPIGTIDFFPNGGSDQPGCYKVDLADVTSVADPVMCDHQRSYAFFAEAILNPNHFIAEKCNNWDEYVKDTCQNDTVTVGDLTTKKKGLYYFETNKEKPYAKPRSAAKSTGLVGSISKLIIPKF